MRSVKHQRTKLISIAELAELTGYSPKTIYNRLNKNSTNPWPIQPKRFGKNGRILFDMREVEQYLAAQSDEVSDTSTD